MVALQFGLGKQFQLELTGPLGLALGLGLAAAL